MAAAACTRGVQRSGPRPLSWCFTGGAHSIACEAIAPVQAAPVISMCLRHVNPAVRDGTSECRRGCLRQAPCPHHRRSRCSIPCRARGMKHAIPSGLPEGMISSRREAPCSRRRGIAFRADPLRSLHHADEGGESGQPLHLMPVDRADQQHDRPGTRRPVHVRGLKLPSHRRTGVRGTRRAIRRDHDLAHIGGLQGVEIRAQGSGSPRPVGQSDGRLRIAW